MTRIQAVALDVDGVLTDGSFWWGPGGQELKRFSFRDVMGIAIGRRAGLAFALISGEDSEQVGRYAAKMGIAAVYRGCKDKAAALRSFSSASGIGLSAIAFMGDDENDVGAMSIAGLAAAPANAHESALRIAAFVSSHPGGDGAVRELIDRILSESLPATSGDGENRDPTT